MVPPFSLHSPGNTWGMHTPRGAAPSGYLRCLRRGHQHSLPGQKGQLGNPEPGHFGTGSDILSQSTALILGTLLAGGLLPLLTPLLWWGAHSLLRWPGLLLEIFPGVPLTSQPRHRCPIKGLRDSQYSFMPPPSQSIPTKVVSILQILALSLQGERLFPVSPVAPLLLAEQIPCGGTSGPSPVGVLPPGPPESMLERVPGTPLAPPPPHPAAYPLLWVQSSWRQSWAPPPGPGSRAAVEG